ncbi:MAG: hypothetical protein ACFE0I_25775 [Elainellaceae cyanobacterium]
MPVVCKSEGTQKTINWDSGFSLDSHCESTRKIAGQGVANYPYHPHHGVRQALSTRLFTVAEDIGGRSLGRDFVNLSVFIESDRSIIPGDLETILPRIAYQLEALMAD